MRCGRKCGAPESRARDARGGRAASRRAHRQDPRPRVLPQASALLVLAEQVLDRIMMLDEGRLDHDVAEIFLDSEVAFQHRLDDLLVMRDAASHELEQIIVSATHEMAFHDLVDLANSRFEPREVPAAMLGQRDLGEYRQEFAELAHIHLGAVAGDVPRLLEPLYAGETGAR